MSKIAWEPNPGPQSEFLARGEFEVLYGGAAGGGKSDALIVEALRQIKYPSYKGIIFRRTLPEAQELIDKSKLIYPQFDPLCKWQEQKKEWHFSRGSVVRFRYLEHVGDETRYQGHEYQYIAFDELTHFMEKQYLYMQSRCRTSDPNIRCYIRAATNPGGPGHQWVKSRFIDIAKPGKTYIDPETGLSRAFIPAKVQDNPKLVQADPLYVRRLEALPEAERRALLDGDWDVFSGQVFNEFRARRHIIHPFEIPDSWTRFVCMDWGFSKPYAVYWCAVDFDNVAYVYRELYGCKKGMPDTGTQETAREVAIHVKEIETPVETTSYRVADPAIWSKTGHDGPSIGEAFGEVGIHWARADNDRLQGKQQFHLRLRGYSEEQPGLKIFSTCEHLIRTLPALCYDDKKVEDVDTTQEDHAYDALRYGLMSRPFQPIKPEAPRRRDSYAYDEETEGDSGWMGV